MMAKGHAVYHEKDRLAIRQACQQEGIENTDWQEVVGQALRRRKQWVDNDTTSLDQLSHVAQQKLFARQVDFVCAKARRAIAVGQGQKSINTYHDPCHYQEIVNDVLGFYKLQGKSRCIQARLAKVMVACHDVKQTKGPLNSEQASVKWLLKQWTWEKDSLRVPLDALAQEVIVLGTTLHFPGAVSLLYKVYQVEECLLKPHSFQLESKDSEAASQTLLDAIKAGRSRLKDMMLMSILVSVLDTNRSICTWVLDNSTCDERFLDAFLKSAERLLETMGFTSTLSKAVSVADRRAGKGFIIRVGQSLRMFGELSADLGPDFFKLIKQVRGSKGSLVRKLKQWPAEKKKTVLVALKSHFEKEIEPESGFATAQIENVKRHKKLLKAHHLEDSLLYKSLLEGAWEKHVGQDLPTLIKVIDQAINNENSSAIEHCLTQLIWIAGRSDGFELEQKANKRKSIQVRPLGLSVLPLKGVASKERSHKLGEDTGQKRTNGSLRLPPLAKGALRAREVKEKDELQTVRPPELETTKGAFLSPWLFSSGLPSSTSISTPSSSERVIPVEDDKTSKKGSSRQTLPALEPC